MGTVKYSGPIASFHCPTEATIRSLKVHFSPKQLGEGTPSPENVREIVGWDGVEVHNCSRPYASTTAIPNEYKKVEYLSSKNNVGQYIDTGVAMPPIAENNLVCKGRFKLDATSWVSAFGGKGTEFCIQRNNTASTLAVQLTGYNNTHVYTITEADADGIEFELSKSSCVINGQTIAVNRGNTHYGGTTIWLFGKMSASSTNMDVKGTVIIYWFQIFDGTTLIRNFVPCIRKSDSKPGMYDTVSQTFYTNAGTGEFIYGPEVNGLTTNYEFGVLGKNKFDGEWELGSISTTTGQNSSASDSIRTKNMISVAPGQKYTISRSDTTSFYMLPFAYKKDGSFSRYLGAKSNTPILLSMNDDEYYLRFYLYQRIEPFENCQLELGSTATAYEPYDPKHTVYGGWVDLVSGEVCETHTQYIFTGEEDFHIIDNYMGKPFVWSFDSRYATDIAFASSTNTNLVCNKLNAVSGRFHYLNDGCICTATSSVYSYVLINGKEILGETNEECKQTIANWYSDGTPLAIIAPLKSEYYKTYQLASYSSALKTFLGQNNVWSNADYVEVEYDLHETQTILARKQFIIAN